MSLTNLNKFQLENSDVITYHTYEGLDSHRQLIDTLKQYSDDLHGIYGTYSKQYFSGYHANAEERKYWCNQLGTCSRKDKYNLCMGYSVA